MERSQSVGSLLVVFDLGGVLAPSSPAITAVAEVLGVSEEILADPYWAYRDAYDAGGTADDYWGCVSEAVGRSIDVRLVERLDQVDVASWATLAADTRSLLTELAGRGVTLAVLSNAPASLATAVRASPWSACFHKLIFSSDVGVLKPDAMIYKIADAALRPQPSGVVFFDDRPGNVAAARTHGWRAHVWTSCGEALEVLAREGVIHG
ncbi:HAD family hydrolase [Nonomuraea turcica]|uniref:HAD family hydrolase n=1 Tax=Nonomuraea sp. G32 TaxID=3067274 RepID=UPI00273BCCAF|nr:HAD family phosphatase [Nonomuraea sp. G32]MDP4501271.1 HAD family phosphatase [Nonomuraea sp. G32]